MTGEPSGVAGDPDGSTAADAGPGLAATLRRRLGRLAGDRGVVAGIAIDHRDSFRVALERAGVNGLTTAQLGALKRALTRALAPAATAIMLDAELGGPALADAAVRPTLGLIMPLEAQGYELQGDRRLTTRLSDFTPLDAVFRGADACKLLVPYRPDDDIAAGHQDAAVTDAVADCHAVGLPLIVEPVVHRLSTESDRAFGRSYRDLLLAAVTRIQALGPDMLKLPFPLPDGAWDEPSETSRACAALADACRETPWVLLGAGIGSTTFADQIRQAGAAGASGFLVGRGIWGPALRADPVETERLAASEGRTAFARLRLIAEQVARPLPTSPER
jgi:tagatose-1,6-bisphosphate aldolase